MLSVDKVTYKYPGDEVETVKDLSFGVKKGEFVSQEVLKHITMSIINN